MTTVLVNDNYAPHANDDNDDTNAHPTIILSPPPPTRPRKRSFRGLFKQPPQPSSLGRRLSNLSLRSNSRPPSPSSSETVGAAAVAASLAAALAVGQKEEEQRLHPNAAYHQKLEYPPSPSSSLSSPRSESPTTMFSEMKRALSQYQQIRHLSLRRRRSSTTMDEQDETKVLKLHEKYGPYRKGRVIGSGATAVIKLLDLSEGSTIAVKTFRKRDRDETEREYHKRMTSEFCISKVLRHPHIVETFDLVQDHKNRWCSVMEYCSGGDVFTVLQDFDLNDSEIDCLFKQLLLGLQHMHQCGVAHRDIKPENLVMTSKGVLKITDFGVADVVQTCFDDTARECRGQCGSEPYWPPELFNGPEYDGRALDVWSAAVTWHCFIYRHIPFVQACDKDPNYVEYMARLPTRSWIPLSKCNSDEKECLYGMFDPDPTTRWTVDQCIASTWIQSVKICSSDREHRHHILA
ncbi:kinase-like domain-containing protein [Fennellomyces sp. T-0311]|nr:kinase-like domain-containing protein [Fennellomyces sp. T-0311]